MPRLARIVLHRGNRRSDVFSRRPDRRSYLEWLSEYSDWYGLRIWAKYIELNPVRAGLVRNPEEYPWSSARAHCLGTEDRLLAAERRLGPPTRDWFTWLQTDLGDRTLEEIRRDTATGRPAGSDEFVARLESQVGRRLRRRKYDRKDRRLQHD